MTLVKETRLSQRIRDAEACPLRLCCRSQRLRRTVEPPDSRQVLRRDGSPDRPEDPVERLANAPMEPFNLAPLGYSATDHGLSVLRSTGFADSRLRRGDVIEVTILDTGEEGMFSSAQSKTLNLGRFTVDSAGTVTSRGLVGSYHLATVTLSVGVARESTVAARGCNAVIPQLRAPAVSARRT
ncbi:hypothetical protein ABCW43_18100 [Neorhizobium sp. IRAMC:178]|uniref:hypothetical protein n=1 Tax=Neorhizobium tunisiense TaxID=3144793 RepID=UPI0031F61E54